MKPTERQFRVEFTVGEKKLGTVLANLDGAPGLRVDLIKEHAAEKNLPKGGYGPIIHDYIGDRTVSRTELLDELERRGMGRPAVNAALYRLAKLKQVKIAGKNGSATVRMMKGAN